MNNFDGLPAMSGKCTLRQRCQLPNNSGIYFVIEQNYKLLYIGKATNLRNRWVGTAHHRYKQLARKGLDRIIIGYILAPVIELDELEYQYIEAFKPLLNYGKVKQHLPKKSPRLSELQRLLKLTNSPLFPSIELTTDEQGNTIQRPAWDLLRGIVAGVYMTNSIPRIVLICKQNMNEILGNSSTHRTKKRFYIQGLMNLKDSGIKYDQKFELLWKFDARIAIFEFLEFFTLGDYVLQTLYPHSVECQIVGVKLRKLNNCTCIESILQAVPDDYIRSIYHNLKPLPDDFLLNEKMIW